MKRSELEHIIRAGGAITNQTDLVVIGSQALLAQYPNAPAELLQSIEADIFPKEMPALSIQIDGAIGERSLFHENFGYYAHGVDETTAVLPAEWRTRLVPIHNRNTGGATGWCLDVHDLTCSKLAAGRTKDLKFVSTLIFFEMIDRDMVRQLILTMPQEKQNVVLRRLKTCEKASSTKNK